MENWGAIFYSQQHLLFDPGSSTTFEKQTVFEVVSHEMAHQWFGDLVTMAWWNNLWLNEGFANWMQFHAAKDLHPEWKWTYPRLFMRMRAKLRMRSRRPTRCNSKSLRCTSKAGFRRDYIFQRWRCDRYARGDAEPVQRDVHALERLRVDYVCQPDCGTKSCCGRIRRCRGDLFWMEFGLQIRQHVPGIGA